MHFPCVMSWFIIVLWVAGYDGGVDTRDFLFLTWLMFSSGVWVASLHYSIISGSWLLSTQPSTMLLFWNMMNCLLFFWLCAFLLATEQKFILVVIFCSWLLSIYPGLWLFPPEYYELACNFMIACFITSHWTEMLVYCLSFLLIFS